MAMSTASCVAGSTSPRKLGVLRVRVLPSAFFAQTHLVVESHNVPQQRLRITDEIYDENLFT